jgi:hypothetical protein
LLLAGPLLGLYLGGAWVVKLTGRWLIVWLSTPFSIWGLLLVACASGVWQVSVNYRRMMNVKGMGKESEHLWHRWFDLYYQRRRALSYIYWW